MDWMCCPTVLGTDHTSVSVHQDVVAKMLDACKQLGTRRVSEALCLCPSRFPGPGDFRPLSVNRDPYERCNATRLPLRLKVGSQTGRDAVRHVT